MATPDYLHRFSPSDPLSSDVTLPFNTRGDQEVNPSHGGDAYAGFALTNNYGENQEVYTEIIGTQLQSPLQPGIQYNLSFDISRAENMGSNPIRIQAFLGSQFSINTEYELPIQNDPNGILLENNTFSDNTTGWDTISFTFTANASHTHLYIGGISNIVFQDPNETSLFPTYYYIDNVSLVMNGILPPNDCSDVSIEISTQMPDCNIFENSSTFDICGTFTTSANASSNSLSLNITNLNSPFPPILSPPVTAFNVTTNNGVLSGNFCVTLNQNSFNSANTYQINAEWFFQVITEPMVWHIVWIVGHKSLDHLINMIVVLNTFIHVEIIKVFKEGRDVSAHRLTNVYNQFRTIAFSLGIQIKQRIRNVPRSFSWWGFL